MFAGGTPWHALGRDIGHQFIGLLKCQNSGCSGAVTMMAFPVNARVGNLKNDDAVCNSALIEPLSAVRYADHARPTSSLVREIGCISEGDEDDGATAVCRPRTPQVVSPIVSAELIFVLAQLALQDCAMLGLPMHHYAISATVMRTRRPVGHIPLRQSPARPI